MIYMYQTFVSFKICAAIIRVTTYFQSNPSNMNTVPHLVSSHLGAPRFAIYFTGERPQIWRGVVLYYA